MKSEESETEAWEVSWPAFSMQMTWREFWLRLSLQPRQTEQIRSLLDELKEEYLHIFSAPAIGGPSPVEHLIQASSGDPGGVDAYLESSLRVYAARAVHAGAGQSYLQVFHAEHLDFLKRFVRLLDGPQRAIFADMALGSLLAVETGRDPLREYVRGRLRPVLCSPEAVCAALGLDGERAQTVTQRLQALREEIAAILLRKAQSGGESPIDLYGRLKARRIPDAPRRFMDYMRAEKDATTGFTYDLLLREAAARANESLVELLGGELAAQLKALGGITMECSLDHDDPVDLAVLAAQSAHEVTEAGPA